jgi:hypothetical protein
MAHEIVFLRGIAPMQGLSEWSAGHIFQCRPLAASMPCLRRTGAPGLRDL